MKNKLLLFALLLAGYPGHSQVIISLIFGDKLNSDKIEFGLDGGVNWSTLHGLAGANSMAGFNLGFYFDFKLKDPNWMVNTGVIVKSPMGAEGLPVYSLGDDALDSSFAGGSVKRKIRYFNVPVMMKYQFRNNLYAKAGIQLGLRSKAFDEFLNTVKDDDDLKYKLKTRDDYHPLDAGLAFGLGYRLMKGNGMNLGVQYYLGLVDVVIDDSSPNQYNRVLYITAGIPIGKGKKNASK
ncbi:MAG TPA: porin family protein [Flavitalea sp.]|nr:porin family protein [Flavitalea sp.]